MTDETRCDLSDLPATGCAHCRGIHSTDRHDPRPTIAARNHTACPGCDGDIETGDRITLDDGHWICGRCAHV